MNPLEQFIQESKTNSSQEVAQTNMPHVDSVVANKEEEKPMEEQKKVSPKLTITKEMMNDVMHAIEVQAIKKGGLNRMVSVEKLEMEIFSKGKSAPVTLVLRMLIDRKLVRYFKMDSGKLIYGFTNAIINEAKGEK